MVSGTVAYGSTSISSDSVDALGQQGDTNLVFQNDGDGLGSIVWKETIFNKRDDTLACSVHMKNIGFMDKINVYSDSIFLFMKERNISVIYQEVFALMKLNNTLDNELDS